MRTFNTMLNMLKTEYSFLSLSESNSLQQVYRDLITSFNHFFKDGYGYPNFKTKRNPKQSFRIQNNKKINSVRVVGNLLRLPKLGCVYFRTSKEYKKLLCSCEINNVTVTRSNGRYYAVVNVFAPVDKLPVTNNSVGIDLGLRNLATLSDGQEIVNLDLSYEDEMINKYYKELSRREYGSNRYNKTLKKLYKWIDKKTNRINNAYHHFTKYLVKSFDTICMEDLNIRGMQRNKHWAPKLHRVGLYKLVTMLKYKCEWYGKTFVQIDRFYPSSQLCHNCGYQHHDLGIGVGVWVCPECGCRHDRDVNASLNIRDEGLRLLKEQKNNDEK